MELITIAEAAEFLKVHRNTIFNMIKRGLLKRYHAGRITRVDKNELIRVLRGEDIPAEVA